MTDPKVLDGAPATLPLMLKAALPAIPGLNLVPGIGKHGDALPDLALTRHDVPVDRAHVAAYAEVCGFRVSETLPVTYPHMLAFGLHMAVLTDASFPFPAIGTVHLENSITQHRPIRASERLQVTVRPEGLRAHPKGRVFDLVTHVHAAGEPVWEETSTFLRVGRSDLDKLDRPEQPLDRPEQPLDRPERQLDQPEPGDITWRLPADLGRRYAAVSGDHNPIHLYRLTAKAFGFPRQIAHGMWSKARCLAALEGRLPEAVTVDVAFKKPVLLPGSVAFGSDRHEDGSYAFGLTRPKDGAPHLVGRVVTAE